MKKSILFLLTALMLAGCSDHPSKALQKLSLQKAVEAITYVKDKAGICYASLASDTSGGYEVISITAVPCEKVRL
ncbi:hypothetical protein JCM14076_32610 [Methylosoma difficile]